MGLIPLEYVISYSSQDNLFKAENLLRNPGSKPWLCSKDNKSPRLEAEFQLNRITQIDFIDIGNHGSSMIEIQAGRSSFQSVTKYVSFLPATSLMSANMKPGLDNNAVFMFSGSSFNSAAAEEKWDRIKVICIQPYKKRYQFGLSFLSLRNKESNSSSDIECLSSIDDSNSRECSNQVHVKEKNSSKSSNCAEPKGKQVLAHSKQSTPSTQSNENESSTEAFEEDAHYFLLALSIENSGRRDMGAYFKAFEEQRGRALNLNETCIFTNTYYEIFLRRDKTSEDSLVSSSKTDSAKLKKSKTDAAHSTKRKKSANQQKSKTGADFDYVDLEDADMDDADLEDAILEDADSDNADSDIEIISIKRKPSFDINQNEKKKKPTKKNFNNLRRKSSFDFDLIEKKKKHTKQILNNLGRLFLEQQRSRLKDKATNSKKLIQLDGTTRSDEFVQIDDVTSSEEFVQFDGAQPSTSSGITFVDCPVCGRNFSTKDIEKHAANCDEYLDRCVTFDESDCVNCPICGELWPEKDINTHVDSCVEDN